jgi:hypothetical protein
MRLASFGTGAFARRPQWSRSKTKETKMRAYTLTELMNLTGAELFALHQRSVDALRNCPRAPRNAENRRCTALLPKDLPQRLEHSPPCVTSVASWRARVCAGLTTRDAGALIVVC